jgi:hypothetical protein
VVPQPVDAALDADQDATAPKVLGDVIRHTSLRHERGRHGAMPPTADRGHSSLVRPHIDFHAIPGWLLSILHELGVVASNMST